jgi:LPS-assembly protein
VFQSGVYTACEPCKDDPRKPPKWQVKAARIIHDEGEKMMYFEGAALEFFGTPLAYLPYFSAPDPTVKRKTGVLVPTSREHGYSVTGRTSGRWRQPTSPSPDDHDRQGPCRKVNGAIELNGSYSIRASESSLDRACSKDGLRRRVT